MDDLLKLVGLITALPIIIAFMLCISAISVLWGAWWGVDVYNWFIPQYFGLPQLKTLEFAGAILAYRCLRLNLADHRDKRPFKEQLTTRVLVISFTPIITWFIAWIVKGFLL